MSNFVTNASGRIRRNTRKFAGGGAGSTAKTDAPQPIGVAEGRVIGMSYDAFAARIDATTVEDLRAVGATKWSDPDVLGAFIAEMDFGAAPVVQQALRASVEEAAFGYAPAKYSAALKEATARYLNDHHGWSTTPEHVLPVPDVLAALDFTLKHFTSPGSKVIVMTPSYMPFLTVPAQQAREVIEVPMLQSDGKWRFDFDGIQRAFDAGAECFILCNPFNPLGRVFARDELLELAAVVDRNNGRVFSDEIWAPLVFSNATLVPYATLNEVTAGHTITATSASKAFNLPGLKCAQLITSNEADRLTVSEVGHFVSSSTATPGMIANAAAFTEGGDWLADVLAYLEGTRDELVELVAEHLPGVKFDAPEGTYVAWLDFRVTGIDDPAAFFLEHAGVGVTDGVRCGEAGRGSARLIFATPRPVLREIIRRMGAAMSAHAA